MANNEEPRVTEQFGEPFPYIVPAIPEPPYISDDTLEATVEWWQDVMPERYKGMLSAEEKELEE